MATAAHALPELLQPLPGLLVKNNVAIGRLTESQRRLVLALVWAGLPSTVMTEREVNEALNLGELQVVGVGDAVGVGAVAERVARRQVLADQLGRGVADLRLVHELPRSAIGKVLKRELRDGYRA